MDGRKGKESQSASENESKMLIKCPPTMFVFLDRGKTSKESRDDDDEDVVVFVVDDGGGGGNDDDETKPNGHKFS